MFVFLAPIIQMGHGKWDTLKDYLSILEQFCIPFDSSMMKCNKFVYIYIYRILHLCDSRNQPDKTNKNFDRLGKIRSMICSFTPILNSSPSQRLVVERVIVLFKVIVIFEQYIPKKHKRFGVKIYKLCVMTGHTYDMSVYMGSDRQNATQVMTAAHARVKNFTRRVEGVAINFTWTVLSPL
jgi:hypothetical protein